MFVLWFTGLYCSGKTTLAKEVAKELKKLNIETFIIDENDLVEPYHERSLLRVAILCKNLRNHGIILCSFVTPDKETRRKISSILGKSYIEIYVEASLALCQIRDMRNNTNKYIKNAYGVDIPYDIPESPHLVVDTQKKDLEKSSIERCKNEIMNFLKNNGYLEKIS